MDTVFMLQHSWKQFPVVGVFANGCFPWRSLSRIFFPPPMFPHKNRKNLLITNTHCCKGFVHFSSHSELGHCLLQGYFEHNICKEPAISDAT